MPETPTKDPFSYSAPFFGLGDTWTLSTEQAQALEDDLKALASKYQRLSGDNDAHDEAEEFYVQLGLVQVRPELRKEIRYKHHKAMQVKEKN